MKRAAFGVVVILLCIVVFLLWAAWQFQKQALGQLAGMCFLLAVIAAAYLPANLRAAWRMFRGTDTTNFLRVKGGK